MKRLATLVFLTCLLPGCGGGMSSEPYVPDKNNLDEPLPETSEETFEAPAPPPPVGK